MKRNYISPEVDTMLCPGTSILDGSASIPAATPGGINLNPNPLPTNPEGTPGDAPRRFPIL